jgi:integrase
VRQGLNAKLVKLRPKLRAEQSKVHFVEPKSRRSRRAITMPAVVMDALKAHQTRQLVERLRAGGEWQSSGLVFTSTIGTPMEAREVTRILHETLTKADLPPVRMHDLRHTAATLLLAQGVDVRTIMEVLGHSQISLTLNTYAHVMPALQADAAGRMDAALASS